MIAHLRGTLIASSPTVCLLECAGVGYEVAISVATYTALPAVGKEARLHIFTKVAEDQLALFGFARVEEKRLFERLLSISGIGPKLAITVLSGVDADRLVQAIRGGDHATLVKIPGIGKKTAERVVLELKDKLDDLAGGSPSPVLATHAMPGGAVAEDVLSALMNLGFPRPAAQKAVKTVLAKSPEAATSFEPLFRAAMAAVR